MIAKVQKQKTDVPEKVTRQIVMIDPNKIELFDRNPRKNDEAAKKLAELIRVHGFTKPVVLFEFKPGVKTVIAGNTATKSARLLGLKEIPSIEFLGTNKEAVAYAIADNKASEFSSWDEGLLVQLLAHQDTLTTSRVTGFSEKELAAMQYFTGARPDALPNVDIQGIQQDNLGELFIIRCVDKEELAALQEYFGCQANTKTIDYTRFVGVLNGEGAA